MRKMFTYNLSTEYYNSKTMRNECKNEKCKNKRRLKSAYCEDCSIANKLLFNQIASVNNEDEKKN